MVGFKTGIGLVLASRQLPKLPGFAEAHGGPFRERAARFLRNIPETNPASIAMSACRWSTSPMGPGRHALTPVSGSIVLVVTLFLSGLLGDLP